MPASSRGKNSLKLLGSVRGRGVLKVEAGSCEVDYQLDRFEGRMGQTASGDVEGPLDRLGELNDGDMATLVLEDGGVVEVKLSQLEDDRADVEIRGAVPGV